MHLHINHTFCTDSNWGGDFCSRYMVCLDRYKKINQIDSENLLLVKKGYDNSLLKVIEKRASEQNWDAEKLEMHKAFCQKDYRVFKEEVLVWLHENVADTKDKKQPKGWCVGSDNYLQRGDSSINVWFVRKSDALAFIEKFSFYKKPTTYFDYFKGISKELDLERQVLKKVEDYSDTMEEYA